MKRETLPALAVGSVKNYDTDSQFDLHRVDTLRKIGYDPYVMVYDKPNAPQNVKDLARWVNNRIIWGTCERFEDYKKAG